MPTRRTQILDALVDHLVVNTDVEAGNCQRFWVYMHEINDWPFIAMLPEGERRQHRSDGRKLASLEVLIRGYIYDGDDPQTAAETLGQQIETAIDSFTPLHRAFEVEEARVTALRIDEGLFKPYGLVDMSTQILYEV
jgi:hypothetical protein